jgi:phosphoribosyl 1,2-cyclic phosphodiesterase
MQLKVINSNSAGNCYLLEGKRQSLLMECGVSWRRMITGMGFAPSRVAGCLVTHAHLDHCCSAYQVCSAGIPLYTSQGTINTFNFKHHLLRPVRKLETFQVGEFKVFPFDVQHDAPEPLCYVIKHPECGSTLFLTDSFYTKYTFEGLNNIIVEANYAQDILDANLAAGGNSFVRNRVLSSHMSIDTCKEFLRSMDLKRVRNIVLVHLSDSNSDAVRFQKEVQAETGRPVHVASAGSIIDFGE